jgi:hypothetical protein
VKLRTESPHASRVVMPPAASVRSAVSTSAAGTKWSWKHCRVVTWAMPPAWASAASATARSWRPPAMPPGSLARIIARPPWRCSYTPRRRRNFFQPSLDSSPASNCASAAMNVSTSDSSAKSRRSGWKETVSSGADMVTPEFGAI